MTDTTIFLPVARDFASIPVKCIRRTAALIISAGSGFAAVLEIYSRAVELAYYGPFQKPVPGKKHSLDEDLEGRDPNW